MPARAVVILVALLALAATAISAYDLEVIAEDGQVRWHLPVRPGTQVALAYVNSLYNAPTEDRFVVTASGLELREVRSTSDAVLNHNMLPAPYARDGSYYVSRIRRRLPSLTTRIGPVGRQRLLVGNSEVPLYTVGIGNAVTVLVRREPLIKRIGRRILKLGRS